jgi:hypothetical protein
MSEIVYNYGPATDNLTTTRGHITNMSNQVSDTVSHCTGFFNSMDANVKGAMQDKINKVITTGNDAVAACQSVNAAAGQSITAMSDTDTGLTPYFT